MSTGSKLRDAIGGDGRINGLVHVVRPKMKKGETMFEAVERLLLHDALVETMYHQGDAAKLLKTTAATVSRKVYKFWPEGGKSTALRRQVQRHGLRAVRGCKEGK